MAMAMAMAMNFSQSTLYLLPKHENLELQVVFFGLVKKPILDIPKGKQKKLKLHDSK